MENITQQELLDLFDYQNGVLYWKVSNTNRIKIGQRAGSANNKGYLSTQVKGKLMKNHRIIFLMCHGFLPEIVDHIDGNVSNNDVSNLRAATKGQNNYNRKMGNNNTSGVKGVVWCKRLRKWQAQLRVNNKNMHLGYFENLDEAKNMVESYRKNLHGVFANHG